MHTRLNKVLISIFVLWASISSTTLAQTSRETFYSQNIGTQVKGFANYECEVNQFELTSDSASIAGSADNFQFVYRELTNDVDLRARIQSNSGSLAGLMIRSGTRNNESFALVGLRGDRTITRYRTSVNANSNDGTSMAKASWVRIRRQGNEVSSFSSVDGQSWVLIEKRALNLGSQVKVGMVGVNGTTAYRNVNVIGKLEDIKVVDSGPVDPDPSDPVTPDPVTPDPVVPDPVVPDPVVPDPVVPDPVVPDPVDPDPVTPDPVVSAGGTVNAPTELLALAVSQSQIDLSWIDNSDNETDFRIRRRQGANGWAVLTELPANTQTFSDTDLIPGTRYTYYVVALGSEERSDRSNKAATTTRLQNSGGSVIPPTPVEPEPTNPEPTDPEPTDPEPTDPEPTDPEPSDPDSSQGQPTDPVNETFNVNDIGTENLSGTASYDSNNDMFRLSASGGQIWGRKDDFHYVYREVTGDVEATVKVSALTSGDEFGKAGIMFRESPNEDSRHAFLTISGGKGVALERRHEAGAGSVRSGKGNVTAPGWLRLIKEGTYISAYYSKDGDNWFFLSEDIINFSETLFIGLAVAAHGEDDTVIADFGELEIVELHADSETETFVSADIGKVGVNGNAAYDAGSDSFLIEAAGGDIGHKDAFHFVFREVTGDFETTAKINSLDAEEKWAKAGLMARDSMRPDSTYFGLFAAKDVGIVKQSRPQYDSPVDWSKIDGVAAPVWVKLTRTGNFYQAHYSTDGTNWKLVDEANLSLSDTLLVGMAVTSHEEGKLAFAEFSKITVDN